METKTILEQLSIVIPIHEFNPEVDSDYLNKCLESIEATKLFSPKEIVLLVTTEDPSFKKLKGIKVIKNTTDKTDFYSQINHYTSICKTEFFSVVEFDDEVSETYLKSFNDYYLNKKDVSVFIPMIVEVNQENTFIKFSNAEPLSRGLIQEGPLCYLPHEQSKMLRSTLISGSFFKTEDLKEVGGFKTNLKISNNFEFIMRCTYSEKKVFVIPKLIYLHKNHRPNSALDQISKSEITKEEVLFWYEIAQKEFYYKRDREVEYSAA